MWYVTECEGDVVFGAHDGVRETLGTAFHMLLKGLSHLNNRKNNSWMQLYITLDWNIWLIPLRLSPRKCNNFFEAIIMLWGISPMKVFFNLLLLFVVLKFILRFCAKAISIFIVIFCLLTNFILNFFCGTTCNGNSYTRTIQNVVTKEIRLDAII